MVILFVLRSQKKKRNKILSGKKYFISIENKMIQRQHDEEKYPAESSSVSWPPSSAGPSDNNDIPSSSVTQRKREYCKSQ